jgi:predicted O-methyltransferase YrrM
MPPDIRAFIARQDQTQAQGLRDLLATLPAGLQIAEIGIYAGESTRIFCESGRVGHLWAIDPWAGNYAEDDGQWFWSAVPWPDVYDTFMAFAADRPEITPLMMPSQQAVKLFADGSLDLVYIDGNHSYASATADIAAWRPKIRSGGWLAGHDFAPSYPGVWRAVREANFAELRVFADTSWLAPL